MTRRPTSSPRGSGSPAATAHSSGCGVPAPPASGPSPPAVARRDGDGLLLRQWGRNEGGHLAGRWLGQRFAGLLVFLPGPHQQVGQWQNPAPTRGFIHHRHWITRPGRCWWGSRYRTRTTTKAPQCLVATGGAGEGTFSTCFNCAKGSHFSHPSTWPRPGSARYTAIIFVGSIDHASPHLIRRPPEDSCITDTGNSSGPMLVG